MLTLCIFAPMELHRDDFDYLLPDDCIALHPPSTRGQSRLLRYRKGRISHHNFTELPSLLPPRSSLFFNDTKVIFARLLWRKATGGHIETMLLEPSEKDKPIERIMRATSRVTWRCAIRNVKKWPQGSVLTREERGIRLEARLIDREKSETLFSWRPEHIPFSHVVATMGQVPLPPYLRRPVESDDAMRYQTVYAHREGGVAAPTAGLHFSQQLLGQLQRQRMETAQLTLHVSGATFQPIKTQDAMAHPMHAERISVRRKALETLRLPDRRVVAVGTTSMRVLESLYWFGVRLLKDKYATFCIDKEEPYTSSPGPLPPLQEALGAVYEALPKDGVLHGQTSIFIVPGYRFKVCDGLITNFHLPRSTLLLLVAAFIGQDWKNVYDEALQRGYRFLSYGDSSLLLPERV